MENQSYYRSNFDAAQSNLCDNDVPLVVNCSGYVSMARAFWTTGSRHDYYLQLMDVGEMTRRTNDGDFRFTPGEFVIHPPESTYCYGLTEDREMGYYWVHFTGNYVETLLEDNRLKAGQVSRVNEEIMPALRRMFADIFHEFILCGQGHEYLCAAKLTAILVELGRAAAGVDSVGKNRFADLLEYIHLHYTENLSITDLAKLEHLSVSRFRDVFRQTFGCSPSEYMIKLRIQRAQDLLSGTDLSVAEVAELCGYSDELYFMRLFRRKTGMSARTYRMEHELNR